MRRYPVPGSMSQRGMAILVITILILLVATIGTLMVGRVGLIEQKVVGTDVRSKEVYSAAIGGMEYALNWFSKPENFKTVVFNDENGNGIADEGDKASPPALANTVLSSGTYSHIIEYELLTTSVIEDVSSAPIIVRVTSQATPVTVGGVGDTHITKTVITEVMLGPDSTFSPGWDSGGDGEYSGPPILMEGCLNGDINGNPAISYDYDGSNPDLIDVAVATTNGLSGGGTVQDCIDIDYIDNHMGLCDIDTYSDSCPNNADVGAEDAVSSGEEFRASLSPPQGIWQTVFGDTTKADLLEMERQNPDRVFIVDSTYPHYPGQPDFNQQWHANVGDEDTDVLLFFDSSVDCPKINGGTTIYGMVYYEKEVCATNGWGGGTIFGTFAKAGDLSSWNANAEIFATGIDFGSGGGGGTTIGEGSALNIVHRYSEIPGTWRDY